MLLEVGVSDAVGVAVRLGVTVCVWLGKRVPVCVNVGNMVRVGRGVLVKETIMVVLAAGEIVAVGRDSNRCAFQTATSPAQ